MKQNQKGITIVGLIITVIVIITIAGVCIYTGRDILEQAKLEQLKTNMLLIQAKCHSVEEKNKLGEENYIGENITEDCTINNYTVTIEDGDKWYKLSANDVNNKIGLGNKEKNDDYYIVNYNENDTVEVVYTPGYNDKYTLTEIKDL